MRATSGVVDLLLFVGVLLGSGCGDGASSTGDRAAGGAGGSGGAGGEPVAATPTFVADVGPMLKQSCAFQSCHGGGSGGFNLPATDLQTMYALVVGQASRTLSGMPLVDPGKPENSFLLTKVEGRQNELDARCVGGRCGGPMPEGAGLLPEEKRATLRAWIAAGASFGELAGTPAPAPSALEPLDLRVELPSADPEFIDFIAGESVIPPGEDRMICTHVRFDGDEDAAFEYVDSIQGKYGHHVVLLGAKEPLPPGTVEDCSAPEDMARYDAYTIGDQELPPGYGVRLPAGHSMVVQAHYINGDDRPIRVRDVVRLKRVAVDKVQTWAAIYVTNTLAVRVPAGEQAKVKFDCRVTKDVDLLVLGGHMHEWGTRFELLYGPDEDHLESLYLASPWVPEYRDLPPMTLFFQHPFRLTAGYLLRTKCQWHNDQATDLLFPHEMCTSFGYVGGTKDPEVCSVE